MALQSPVRRVADAIDPRRTGDYPILLGDSLKQSGSPSRGLVSLRYNFEPEKGLLSGKSVLTKHKAGPRSSYKLAVEDGSTNDTAYTYSGRDVTSSKDEEPTALALVFEKSRSAFVLESISTSLDFNLTSAPADPRRDIENLPQLPSGATSQSMAEPRTASQKVPVDKYGDDEVPDPNNPYDYRNFLSEAREAAEHTPAMGSHSPLPGNRTPLGGMHSPVPGASRFLSSQAGGNTPQVQPTSHPTSAPTPKKRKAEQASKPASSTPRFHPTAPLPKKSTPKHRRADAKPRATQALSKERITDSDSSDADAEADMSDTITVARPQAYAHHLSPEKPRPSTSHGRSPHIVVDDPSGLEIDMGSPPRANASSHQRARHVNRDAFRSQTGTPSFSHHSLPVAAAPLAKHARHADSDISMSDADADNDADVEALELGSPRTTTRTVGSSHTSSRIQSVEPDEDEDDDLAAVLEAALEEEEQEQAGVGLGISAGGNDEESEVSEEE